MIKVVSAIDPPLEIRKHLVESYKGCDFHFFKGLKNADSILKEMDVLITYGEDLDAELIHLAPELKWISVMSAGIEKLPFDAIREKDIMVTNARGIHAIPMAEYVMGMMLSHVKQFPAMALNQDKHTWNRKLPFGELRDKKLLILGTGAIGSEIGRLAKAFGMNTLGLNRSGYANSSFFDDIRPITQIDDVLTNADFIISVLPSTVETKWILKYKHFEMMKKEAMFINIGRGDLMEENTIHEVLENQVIDRLVLDVFPSEPLGEESKLWSYPNLTITPHISSISQNYLPRAFEIFETNLQHFMNQNDNEYVNKIDLRKGY